MTEPPPQPESALAPARAADWEAFYRDYRKPGYVSGFEITTKLGGGMFGLVYRARKQSIGKDYAIKFLQVDDGEVRRAVLAELEQVQYFAQIDHPNLVSIEDRGEVDGIPFLVMSFAGTETLRDRMPTDGRPPSPGERDELVRYFLQCCRGLSALHERSLVHFDIKPANVFLKGAVARLGDYGLSKLVTHSRGSLSMGRGTPYYMAPEMLQRRGDHRSDIYSLGVMLYEILCGRVPFTGDSEWAVLKQHESKAPELPPHLSPLERTVLQRCLQKDPAARFQSVHDLIAAFGAQASVGAAAWSDVRAGAGATPAPATVSGPMTTPPPLPVVPPLPLPEPGSKAEQIAEKALLGARKVVRATSEAVRETVQELRRDGSGRGTRHRRAMARLRARMHWPPRKARAPREPATRSGTVGKVLLVVGIAALALIFLFVLLAPVAMRPTPGVASSWGPMVEVTNLSVEEPPPPPPVDRSRSATFTRFVPRRFTDLVSTAEPTWVALAQRDREAAEQVLDRSLEELRRRVPFLPEDRAGIDAAALPTFGDLRSVPPAEHQAIVRLVERTLASREPEETLAAEFVRQGPVALAMLAQRLGEIPYADQEDVARAHRAHAVLQRATGCHEMPLVVEGSLPAIERANRHVGTLWCWFLNEVAHTERTWVTYRNLRGGR